MTHLSEAGVVLLRVDVHHPGEAGQEAREAVLHLLGRQLLEAVLQVFVGHQVGGARHLGHHDWLGLHEVEDNQCSGRGQYYLHEVEGALLDDGGLLAQGDAHFEGVAGVPGPGHHLLLTPGGSWTNQRIVLTV